MATGSPGPHSGDDTYDLIDNALTTLAERRGAWLGDDLTAITLVASLIGQAERCLPELVTNARLNGHTWEQTAQSPGHQPRRRPAALRRISHRRRQMTPRPLTPISTQLLRP